MIDFRRKIELKEDDHTYWFENKKIDAVSITTLMGKLSVFGFCDNAPTFGILLKKLPSKKETIDSFKDEVNNYMNEATTFGTLIHKRIEENFYEQSNKYEARDKENGFSVFKELVIWNKKNKIIGTVDYFAVNFDTKEIKMIDHKVSNGSKEKYVSTQLTIAKLLIENYFEGEWKWSFFLNEIKWSYVNGKRTIKDFNLKSVKENKVLTLDFLNVLNNIS